MSQEDENQRLLYDYTVWLRDNNWFVLNDQAPDITVVDFLDERARKPQEAVVEEFVAYCHCKPPRLDQHLVCRCGTVWKRA